jgi:5-methylcytosine-specific restriction endonuclease McrA
VFGAKAEILEYDHQIIRTVSQEFHAPSVIRLQHRIRRPRPRVKLTRREVFTRDRHTCQYCGRVASDLTLDHILPRHKDHRRLIGVDFDRTLARDLDAGRIGRARERGGRNQAAEHGCKGT